MIKVLSVKLTLTEAMLGAQPGDPAIHAEFIASNAPDAPTRTEEIGVMGVQEVVEKSMTIFPKENGKPFLWDYQVKGFFKDACGVLSRVGGKEDKGNESSKLKAYKKIIDGLIFVKPRKIFITLPPGGVIGSCQRPLRAQTAQGERIALANSEEIPAGSTMDLTIHLLDDKLEKAVREWLDYGQLRGLGQWRNSGKGTFSTIIS